MSGAKTITVDQGAWNRAQRSARQLADVQRNLPRMLDDVRRAAQADIDRAVAPIQRRQAQTERQLNQLSAYTRDIERRTDARFREQAQQLRDFKAETRREVRRLDRDIRLERAERERQVAELNSRIDDINRRRDSASALAQEFLRDARQMVGIVETLPHERFAPGRLAALRERLATTAHTAGTVDAAFALSSAQDVYLELSRLRQAVQAAELEWLSFRSEALRALHDVDWRIGESAKRPATEDGKDIPGVVLDVDFWTDGALNKLRDEVRAELAAVSADACSYSVEELREIIQRHAPAYDERLTELVELGATRMFASQTRYNTAEKIVDALKVEGYDYVEDTYQGEDYRESHFTRLEHRGGEGEIVVEVAPEGDCGMSIKLLSYDRDPAESRRGERTDNVLAKLRDAGIPVGRPADRGTEPTPEEGDFKLIRERRRRVG